MGSDEYSTALKMMTAAGYAHTILLEADRKVWACGNDDDEQLGNDTASGASLVMIQVHDGAQTPEESDKLEDIACIAAGAYHSLAVDVDGKVWSWGSNTYGQLGDDGKVSEEAVPIEVLKGEQPGTGQLENIAQIVTSNWGEYSLARDNTSNRYVWAWGYNNCGQLGNGKSFYDGGDYSPNQFAAYETTPVQVLTGEQDPGGSTYLKDIIDIDAGRLYSIALDADGYVWCWGFNHYGQLGNDSTDNSDTPVQVLHGEQDGDYFLKDIIDVVACNGNGTATSYALDKNGYVWAWGDNQYGQLGDDDLPNDSNTPVQVVDGEQTDGTTPYLQDIIAISGGDCHVLALDNSGNVWAWGYNVSGQLGNGSTTVSDTPVQVEKAEDTPLTDIVSISAGFRHSTAIDVYGDVWVWGLNSDGQLGLNHTNDEDYATQIP